MENYKQYLIKRQGQFFVLYGVYKCWMKLEKNDDYELLFKIIKI